MGQHLIRGLESSDVDTRLEAARTLAQVPSMGAIMERDERDITDAMGPLAVAFFDEDAGVRKLAARAIDAAQSDQQAISVAIPALVRGLSDERVDVRRSALLILRNAIVRGLDATPFESLLSARLTEPDPKAKWGAADALAYHYAAGKRWEEVANLLGHADPDVAQETAGTLAEFWHRLDYEPVVASLLTLLSSKSLELGLVAAKAVVHHPRDVSDLAAAFRVLLECLSNEEARIRMTALRALAVGISNFFLQQPFIQEQDSLGPADWQNLAPVIGTLPAIKNTLSDSESEIQAEAIEALTIFLSALPVNELGRYEEFSELLEKQLCSDHDRVQGKAAVSLTVLWVRAGRWDDLIGLLANPSPEIKRRALHTLARHHAIRGSDLAPVVPAILPMLSDPSGDVRYAAYCALEGVDASQLLGPLESEPIDTDTRQTLLKKVRAKVYRKPLTALKSELEGKCETDRIALLTTYLDHPLPTVRSWAAESLWWLGQSTDISAAIPPLAQLLEDPDPSCRREAASALGDAARYGSIEQAHKKLARLTQDESAEVRKLAFRALGMSADYSAEDLSAVLPTLFETLRFDPDQENRGEAAYVISTASRRTDLEAYVPSLAAALEDEFQRVRFYVARALHYAAKGGADIQTAVPALARALQDEQTVASWAAEALLLYASDDARAAEVLKAAGDLDSRRKQVNRIVRACEKQLAGS